MGSPFWPHDLIATFAARPRVYVIPKVEKAADLHRVSQRLAQLEGAAGLPIGSVRLLAIVESAAGVMNLGEIAGADQRLVALALGAEDFASDVGAQRTQCGVGGLLRPQRGCDGSRGLRLAGHRHRLYRPDRRGRPGRGMYDDEEDGLSAANWQSIPRQVEIINAAFTAKPVRGGGGPGGSSLCSRRISGPDAASVYSTARWWTCRCSAPRRIC